MKRALFLLGFALAGGAATGWFTAGPPSVEGAPVALAPPSPAHGGTAAAEARRRVGEAGLAGAAEPTDVQEAPPPPDIAVLFRRDVTAVEQRPDGARVWIVDFTRDFGRRALRVGDVYQDRWRVTRISPQWVELRRRRETRRVGLFEAPPDISQ